LKDGISREGSVSMTQSLRKGNFNLQHTLENR